MLAALLTHTAPVIELKHTHPGDAPASDVLFSVSSIFSIRFCSTLSLAEASTTPRMFQNLTDGNSLFDISIKHESY
jgi:hypothetical protein